MPSVTRDLTERMAEAFVAAGFDRQYSDVVVSSRPDLGQYQCNGALAAAKAYRSNPRQIAQAVVDKLEDPATFKNLSLAGPGFINIVLADAVLTDYVQRMANDDRLACPLPEQALKIVVDYGGPNVAKPLHVGHVRPAIIGESIKRLARFLGHTVLGDVHLGDWGLQMGMLIAELARRQPDLVYFDPDYTGEYPGEPPISLHDLEEMYPTASQRSKDDPVFLETARQATAELQNGRPGYHALWRHFVNLSVTEMKADYKKLGVEFDLWLGESDAHPYIEAMVTRLKADGYAQESRGALIVDVSLPDDKQEIPPMILLKSDGAALYSTTDLATIVQRMQDYQPDMILYVVDQRQSNHFNQVFRAAYKSGIVPETTLLEHDSFGTMNGKDGKPFKTRAGGNTPLKQLLQLVTDKARERMNEIDVSKELDDAEREHIAELVGMATLKFADLSNHRTKDYIFDLDRFSSFEGKTGPYLLYTAVRGRSILRRAAESGLQPGPILPPSSDTERNVLLELLKLSDILSYAFDTRSPNHLCEYAYDLATAFNRFYHEHHILRETDPDRQASWLGLSELAARTLELVLDLLGIAVPERM